MKATAPHKSQRPNRLKFIIFSSIGIFNTLFDIALYVVILNISHNIVVANLIATSAALIGSYFLNSRITFQSKTWTTKTFVQFIVVTVFGLWVLQTTTIYEFNHLLAHVPEQYWRLLGGLEKTGKQVIPKLFATVVTFVWNYVWYSKVIFKQDSDEATRLAYTDL